MNILIVGAGALGSRHLQACLKINRPCNIYVVDPSKDSLDIAKERAEQVITFDKHNVSFFQSLEAVDASSIAYAIVATNANYRYEVSCDVIKRFKPTAIILEKVLFQTLEEYSRFSEFLVDKDTIVFVNCPFRTYPVFNYIKSKYLNSDSTIQVDYSGGEWIGLCCNAIHYIDLTSYLSESVLSDVETNFLDSEIIASKRKGYIEITGKLVCHFSDNSILSLSSAKGSDRQSEFVIKNRNYEIYVDELSGDCRIYQNGELCEEKKFNIVYQSELTNLIIEQIEITGVCGLSKYNDSAAMHKILVSNLLSFYNEKSGISSDLLPIT